MAAFSSSSAPETTLPEFEVEQKFALQSTEETARIEKRLKDLGFEKSKAPFGSMVDWYWDNRQWTLTTQDCWLRLRQIKSSSTSTAEEESLTKRKSSWQLKLARKIPSTTTEQEFATVYEEVTGRDAITKAMALLSTATHATTTAHVANDDLDSSLIQSFLEKNNQIIPKEMTDGDTTGAPLLLTPFAMIETKRSTWIPSSTYKQQHSQSSQFASLKVDFDTATYGSMAGGIYAVGEVEQVVHSQEEIPNARMQVQNFLEQLMTAPAGDNQTITSNSKAPVGKLEFYLMHHRPKHYQALVDSGILK